MRDVDLDKAVGRNIQEKIGLRVGGRKKLEQLDDGAKMIENVRKHDFRLKG